MIEEVYGNIFRIQIPLPNSPLKGLNSYLLRGSPRSLLIDTGFRMPECRDALFQALAGLDVDMECTDIFLTHLHSDHTGLAPEIATDDTQVFLSAVDIGYFLDFQNEKKTSQQVERLLRKGFSMEELERMDDNNPARQYAPRPFKRLTPVQDGDMLNYAGYNLRCVATPGHTPGHTCLYLPEEKLIFLGDHVLFDITPNITDWAGFDNSLGAYLSSLDTIAAYDITMPLPAHRGVKGTVYERIESLKQHHHKRLEEVMSILRRRPGQRAYDIAGKMTWSIVCDSWQEFPLKQKWFAVGEAASHLDYLIASGLACRENDGAYDLYQAM